MIARSSIVRASSATRSARATSSRSASSSAPVALTVAASSERMGHSKASMSLDVYTHVMPPDEVQPEMIVVML